MQPSIKVSSLWLIQEPEIPDSCSFKGAYLFYKTSSCNFCWQPHHSFMVKVLIWQIRFYSFELVAIHSICALKMFIFSRNSRSAVVCESFFLNSRPKTLSKKRLQCNCFPVSFVKFTRIAFLWRYPSISIKHFTDLF